MESDSSDDGGGELSLVKTDWNCLSKMLAFDLLSLQSVILAFRLDVPPERLRIVLGKPFLDGIVYKVPFRLSEESFTFLLGVPVVCPRSCFPRLPIESPLLLGEAP